jgi:coenzyme F420-reducing hydrogenase beta subunit
MKAYALYNKNEEIREKSSSGGVFYELAKAIINKNGVVFGAMFDDEWNVVHSYAENLDDLKPFLGSKYAQSTVGTCYKDVKKFLEAGRLCLFSGTPCQVTGLKSFLGKEYNNLLTVDFICHGVPSRLVWREYVKNIGKNDEIKCISFRDKTEGWLSFSMKFEYKDGSVYRKNLNEDLFMQGFLQDIYLRPSCYSCAFKGVDRKSDITLADYWGVQLDCSEMFDDKGTSFVMIHSGFGDKIYKEIEDNFVSKGVNPEKPLSHNPSAMMSAKLPPKRKVFYKKDYVDFDLLEKLTKQSKFKNLFIRILNKVKRIIKKLLRYEKWRGAR